MGSADMAIDITLPAGVRVGHWTDDAARTGCTVVVMPPGTVASGEVRGGAPASREFALLDPTRTVQHIDALCLSGGSAFGLGAADGVVAGLQADGRGFPTPAGPVPIVVGLSIFDLAVGDGSAFPGPHEGRRAYDAADRDVAVGSVGAGAGATVAKWAGRDAVISGGFGAATMTAGAVVVTALVVVNAYGEVDDGTALQRLARGADRAGAVPWPGAGGFGAGTNTTIGVIVTNAVADKVSCQLMAQGAHDGLARAVFPPHTSVDGDAFVAAATGEVTAPTDLVRALSLVATESAIRSAVSQSP